MPQGAKGLTRSEDKMPAALSRELERNWHRSVMQFWAEVWPNLGSVEERAARLAAVYAAQRGKPLNSWKVKRHVLRKLALDLICASFPEGHPPPAALILLMKRALDLPESHEVGGWPIVAGTHDDRGDPDHEVRNTAMLIDWKYLEEHDKWLPLRKLAKLVQETLHREPDRKSLRRWRCEKDYCGGLWLPPSGGGK
jgi:hypothetical protein